MALLATVTHESRPPSRLRSLYSWQTLCKDSTPESSSSAAPYVVHLPIFSNSNSLNPHLGLVLSPQPVRSTRLQPPHVPLWNACSREQRRYTVTQAGTSPHSSCRTVQTNHTSSPASCPPRSSLISSGSSKTIKMAFQVSSSFFCGCSRHAPFPLTHARFPPISDTPCLVPNRRDLFRLPPPARLPVHGSRRRYQRSHWQVLSFHTHTYAS